MAPEPFAKSVKFDGKHWIGKKRPNEPLQVHSCELVAQIAREKLGKNGIVAIPNARPNEYRFEEFINMWKRHALSDIDSGKVFYDKKNEIYFVKAQEIKTKTRNIPITILAYNVPFENNLKDKNLQQVMEDADKMNCFLGINLPACARNIEDALCASDNLLGNIDFVVGYSGSAALFNANEQSIEFYRREINGNEFCNPFSKEIHKVGVIAVSGGHKTPRGKFEEFLNGRQTIGRSYTEIQEPSQNNFMKDLRQGLRSSTEKEVYCEPIIVEAIKSQLSIKVGDKISGLFK